MRIQRPVLVMAFAAIAAAVPFAASAQYLPVYGGPTYDSASRTGYLNFMGDFPNVFAGNGVAVGYAVPVVAGTTLGARAFRWDASGRAATELGHLGTNSAGTTWSIAAAVNAAGTTVGSAEQYAGDTDLGARPVSWDPISNSAVELGNLGTSGEGFTWGRAVALNNAGVAVGYMDKYVGGVRVGPRAVRWGATGAASELGSPGANFGEASATAINDTGTAVGAATKFVNGNNRGPRALRWDVAGAGVELGNLGTDNTGATYTLARAINGAGTAVGFAEKYVGGILQGGGHAVRWDASGTAATELGGLTEDGSGPGEANAINAAGTAVGWALKMVGGTSVGGRAVRWDASGAAVTELGNLGTDASGNTGSVAYSINGAGAAVGFAQKYTGGAPGAERAVLWDPAGRAIDLNDLIDPASGWTLTRAASISDTNWVTGVGQFDPDGPGGPLEAYARDFLLDAGGVVPEPSTLGMLGLAAVGLLSRPTPPGRCTRRHLPG